MLFLVHFDSFSWRILTFTDEESPKVLKLVQIFIFEGVWNELFAKKLFLQTILVKIYWQIERITEKCKSLQKRYCQIFAVF